MTQVRLIGCAAVVALLAATPARAQETPAECQQVVSALGRLRRD